MPALTDEQWDEMKNEFITTKISFRRLAEKYDIAHSAISKRAAREGWAEKRAQFVSEVETQLLKKNAKNRANQINRAMLAVSKVLDCALDALDDHEQFNRHIVSEGRGEGVSITEERIFEKVDTKALKDLVSVVKEATVLLRDHYDAPTGAEAFARKMAKENLKLAQAKNEPDEVVDVTVTMNKNVEELAE